MRLRLYDERYRQMSSTKQAACDHASLQQAAQWYAQLHAEDVTEQERSDWQRWLQQHPRHLAAWQHIETVASRFDCLRAESEHADVAGTLRSVRQRQISRRDTLKGLALLGCFGVSSLIVGREMALPAQIAARTVDYRTARGEVRDFQLPDGSHVWLNTASSINSAYTHTLRQLQLLAGEILIDTAPDSLRPFEVATGQGVLRALGTRFTVRENQEQIFIAVFDGAVEVRAASGDSRIINAGQQTTFNARHIQSPEPADPAREAWSQGLLLANDISLSVLVSELERYRHCHISLAPEVADLRVMGAYPLDDLDLALDMLAATVPVSVRHTLPWWISIDPRP